MPPRAQDPCTSACAMGETNTEMLNVAPVVGIAVPAFNASWSIGDTIRSIRAQKFTEFRCVVVDDGSTEGMGPEIASATADDDRFTVVAQKDRGLAAARNRGLDEVYAPFTAFIDSGDLWHPDFVKKLVAKRLSTPDAPFAYAHSLRVDRANRLFPTARWPHEPRHDLEGLLCLNTVASGSAAVYRTKALRGAGGFDPTFRSRDAEGAEDWHLLLRLASVAPPVLVPEYLGVYRLNEQGMSQGNPERQLRSVHSVMEDARKRYPQRRDEYFRDAHTASVPTQVGWPRPIFLPNIYPSLFSQ
jgi:glycosyltransferase involved in cell wall biosynthesis